MNALRIISPAALLLLLAGCSTQSAQRTTEVVTSPIIAPINAAVNNTLPLPQETQYTYWRRIPDTNLFEPYTGDHPLTRTEQQRLGIVTPENAAPVPVSGNQ